MMPPAIFCEAAPRGGPAGTVAYGPIPPPLPCFARVAGQTPVTSVLLGLSPKSVMPLPRSGRSVFSAEREGREHGVA